MSTKKTRHQHTPNGNKDSKRKRTKRPLCSIKSNDVRRQLELYDKQYCPEDYIFYGREKSKPMCRSTVNRIIRNANFVLKTNETITPQTFRHSFATMLTEEGESSFIIQKILGHKSIYSTLRYTKSAKAELKSCINPLDKIYENNV